MPKFIVLQGLPASGKTTKAFDIINADLKSWVRINNDDIRKMFWGTPYDSQDEGFITEIRWQLIKQAIYRGKNIIIDNINLNPKLLDEYRETAKLHGYEYEEVLVDTPLEVCIIRDSYRNFPVGEQVIKRFAKMLPKKEPFKLEQNPNLPKAIICDLDGTLALFGDRPKYDRDYENDEVNWPIRDIIKTYHDNRESVRIIFVSGRKEKFRDQTVQFLREKCGFNGGYLLLMRGDDDNREDSVVKLELFNEFIRDRYYIEFVIDDRNRVVKMWRDLGLTVLQVAEGNF